MPERAGRQLLVVLDEVVVDEAGVDEPELLLPLSLDDDPPDDDPPESDEELLVADGALRLRLACGCRSCRSRFP